MNRPVYFLLTSLFCFQILKSQNSVLSSGSWYKIGVAQDGVYRLGYSDLQNLGINPAAIDPRNVRIYGNGGGMLPESNAAPRANDLLENAITVMGEGDGVFNSGDYILFYGQSQHRWKYNASTQHFEHFYNIYSDTTYYFITTGLGPGKRITLQVSSLLPATDTITTFDDYAFYEAESENFLHSGREWYGDQFDSATTNRNYSFSFSNIVTSDSVYALVKFAARSVDSTSTFSVSGNGSQVFQKSLAPVCPDYTCPFANTNSGNGNFVSALSQINIGIYFSNPSSSANGWLDYIELNTRRNLVFIGSPMLFRDIRTVGTGKVSEIIVVNTSGNLTLWDVSDPQNVKTQETVSVGILVRTRVQTDVLKEFVLFDGSALLTPELYGSIPNQNLHGVATPDLLIVTAPEFLSAANQLASHHQSFDGLSVAVTTTKQIYNEFSSGAQDITAIRDFARMLYLNASPDSLKYLLLFGDASYDYKDRITGNTNFVPGYESSISVSVISTYFSDDYFGLFDTTGGILTGSILEIGVGRLPVKTVTEASTVVNKLIHYTGNQTLGKWRKEAVFIGDDEDGNIHFSQANQLATYVDETYCEYNVNKIFLDAYPEIIDSQGNQRYPAVKQAIYDKVHSGTLLLNYTGHGGINGWAHERILDTADVDGWNNKDKLLFIIGATSEMMRLNDPSFVSIGERAILNPAGGSVASFGATNLIYSGANLIVNDVLIHKIFEPLNGEMPRLGDIVRLTKNSVPIDINNRKNILIGDPAMKLTYPKHDIVLTSVNGNSISMFPDSFSANALVTIGGRIEDNNANLLSGFNGKIFFDLFDKQGTDTTLANNPASYVDTFRHWRLPVVSDSSDVTNGLFSFSFTVPAGVDSIFDFGKLSLYAMDGTTDASGCYANFYIGGGNQSITAIPSFEADLQFLIYPSPVIGQAIVEIHGFRPNKATFAIYDDTGKEVRRMENISENKFSFSSDGLASGMYLFTFLDKTNSYRKSGKLMIH